MLGVHVSNSWGDISFHHHGPMGSTAQFHGFAFISTVTVLRRVLFRSPAIIPALPCLLLFSCCYFLGCYLSFNPPSVCYSTLIHPVAAIHLYETNLPKSH